MPLPRPRGGSSACDVGTHGGALAPAGRQGRPRHADERVPADDVQRTARLQRYGEELVEGVQVAGQGTLGGGAQGGWHQVVGAHAEVGAGAQHPFGDVGPWTELHGARTVRVQADAP